VFDAPTSRWFDLLPSNHPTIRSQCDRLFLIILKPFANSSIITEISEYRDFDFVTQLTMVDEHNIDNPYNQGELKKMWAKLALFFDKQIRENVFISRFIDNLEDIIEIVGEDSDFD
jgi:hypothetical protein